MMQPKPRLAELDPWACPLPVDRLHGVLEGACHWGATRVVLKDTQGRERARIDGKVITHLEGYVRSAGPREVSADVVIRGNAVGTLIATVQGDVRQDPEAAIQVTADHLSAAWSAAEEIDSLAAEIVRVYEELHLLYGMSETLTDQLTVVDGANYLDLILDKILTTVAASWAELELSESKSVHRRVTEYSGPIDIERHPGHHLLKATLRSGGQTVGFITLGRPLTAAAFSAGEGMLLNAVSTLVANATRSAQLYEKLRRQTETLSARETHLRAVLDNVAEGIITIDDFGTVESLNPAAEKIFGVSATVVVGHGYREIINPPRDIETQPDRFSGVGWARDDQIGPLRRTETLGKRSDGALFPIDIAISEMHLMDRRRFILSVRDIGERKRLEDVLRRQATRDALTDLPNRVLLRERLDLAISTAQHTATGLALLIMDLDHFKDVNDTFGHQCGDRLLQMVATRLQAALRDGDTIARLGGDEFSIVLPGSTVDGASIIARRLSAALDQPFTIEDRAFNIGASIGIALYPEHGTDGDTLLRRADVSMYSAKRSHAGHAVYSAALDYNSPNRMDLLGELRTAIEQDQMTLHYQPLVDFKSREVVRAEALVRWEHPRHGLVLPANFIPIAEQTGLIKPLSAWILNAAIRQARAWWDAGHRISMAVNLSAQTLHDPELVGTVIKYLERWGMPASCLKLEITENCLLFEPGRAMDVLLKLRTLGTHVGIDDFGTGYSSLAYLKRLPIDEIKIDKCFVLQMAKDDADSAIVRSTIGLAHELGLTVVAEGIETLTTWNLLAALGCDTAQGYFLSPPIPPNGFVRWLDGVNNASRLLLPDTTSLVTRAFASRQPKTNDD